MTSENIQVRTHWFSVLLVVLAAVMAAFQMGKVPPSLPILRHELGLSLVAAGWLISIFYLIGALGGTLVGAVADRIGHRSVMIGALGVLGCASASGSLAGGPIGLLVSRFLEGMGYVCIMVSSTPLIIRSSNDRDREVAIAFWSCSIPLGMASMMLISPLLLETVGWRGLWITNTALIGMLLFFFIPLTRSLQTCQGQPYRPARGSFWEDITIIVTSRGPQLLTFLFLLYSLQFLAVSSFLPTVLIEEVQAKTATAAVLTGLTILCNLGGNILSGQLLKRGIPRGRLIAAASIIMGLMSVVIYSRLFPGEMRYLSSLLFIGVGGLIPASLVAGITTHAPKPSLVGTTAGIVFQGAMLGSVIGPPTLAFVVRATGGWHGAPVLLLSAAGLSVAASDIWSAPSDRLQGGLLTAKASLKLVL